MRAQVGIRVVAGGSSRDGSGLGGDGHRKHPGNRVRRRANRGASILTEGRRQGGGCHGRCLRDHRRRNRLGDCCLIRDGHAAERSHLRRDRGSRRWERSKEFGGHGSSDVRGDGQADKPAGTSNRLRDRRDLRRGIWVATYGDLAGDFGGECSRADRGRSLVGYWNDRRHGCRNDRLVCSDSRARHFVRHVYSLRWQNRSHGRSDRCLCGNGVAREGGNRRRHRSRRRHGSRRQALGDGLRDEDTSGTAKGSGDRSGYCHSLRRNGTDNSSSNICLGLIDIRGNTIAIYKRDNGIRDIHRLTSGSEGHFLGHQRLGRVVHRMRAQRVGACPIVGHRHGDRNCLGDACLRRGIGCRGFIGGLDNCWATAIAISPATVETPTVVVA